MRVRRAKPYVCVDCDYAEHFSFQETKDIDAAGGAASMPHPLAGAPTFGKERILQLPPEEWHEDDFSDLGAEVLR